MFDSQHRQEDRERVSKLLDNVQPEPSREALLAVEELEADARDRSDDPDWWRQWTPAYRLHIARMLDRCFRRA